MARLVNYAPKPQPPVEMRKKVEPVIPTPVKVVKPAAPPIAAATAVLNTAAKKIIPASVPKPGGKKWRFDLTRDAKDKITGLVATEIQ